MAQARPDFDFACGRGHITLATSAPPRYLRISSTRALRAACTMTTFARRAGQPAAYHAPFIFNEPRRPLARRRHALCHRASPFYLVIPSRAISLIYDTLRMRAKSDGTHGWLARHLPFNIYAFAFLCRPYDGDALLRLTMLGCFTKPPVGLTNTYTASRAAPHASNTRECDSRASIVAVEHARIWSRRL